MSALSSGLCRPGIILYLALVILAARNAHSGEQSRFHRYVNATSSATPPLTHFRGSSRTAPSPVPVPTRCARIPNPRQQLHRSSISRGGAHLSSSTSPSPRRRGQKRRKLRARRGQSRRRAIGKLIIAIDGRAFASLAYAPKSLTGYLLFMTGLCRATFLRARARACVYGSAGFYTGRSAGTPCSCMYTRIECV